MRGDDTIKYVIIQAGGKGTRMGKYTWNKPKALVSVDSLPMIFHTFKVFKNSNFIIIGDYKYEVLREYLKIFSDINYILIKTGEKGTCAGLNTALKFIPQNEPLVYVWSDLVLPKDFELNLNNNKNLIGISKDFECRWSYKNGEFVEEKSKEFGVAGFFVFNSKKEIEDVPSSGEFVKYLKSKNIEFDEIPLYGTKEFGIKEEYEEYIFSKRISRPFNEVKIANDKVIKIPLDEKGFALAEHESNWYKYISTKSYSNIPKVLSLDPITLEKVDGLHPFEVNSYKDKKKVLDKILEAFEKLHNLSQPIHSNYFSLEKEYYVKTFERMDKVYKLIPFATEKEIKINNKWFLNPFYLEEDIKNLVREFYPEKFHPIHGDPTFSNMLIDKNLDKVYLIDPRGYFGFDKIYGDKDYDYAKLYYSLKGNYDKFNQKHFDLKIENTEVFLDIESNEYEQLEEYFFENIKSVNEDKIKLLHAIIWLSLTTYAWDDYDSICGAFYNGTIKLGEVI